MRPHVSLSPRAESWHLARPPALTCSPDSSLRLRPCLVERRLQNAEGRSKANVNHCPVSAAFCLLHSAFYPFEGSSFDCHPTLAVARLRGSDGRGDPLGCLGGCREGPVQPPHRTVDARRNPADCVLSDTAGHPDTAGTSAAGTEGPD